MNKYTIKQYSDEYKDDMFICYLSAKEAINSSAKLRDDLFDSQNNKGV